MEGEVAAGRPGVKVTVEGVAGQYVLQHQQGGGERNGHAENRDAGREPARNHATEQAGECSTDQRGQRNGEVKGFHVHATIPA